jgi:hypothetical protein
MCLECKKQIDSDLQTTGTGEGEANMTFFFFRIELILLSFGRKKKKSSMCIKLIFVWRMDFIVTNKSFGLGVDTSLAFSQRGSYLCLC